MTLTTFTTPGNVTDLSPEGRQRWSGDLASLLDSGAAGNPGVPGDSPRSQFFNQLTHELDTDSATKPLEWGAFPRKLAREPAPLRWQLGEQRIAQEEYCEWAGERDEQGRLTRAMFTTEFEDYYLLLANDNPQTLINVYRTNISEEVQESDILSPTGAYRPGNIWNARGAMHMVQTNNTIGAAVLLVAQSTIVRAGDAGLLTNANDLIRCGVVADPDRNSDPLIVTEINTLARAKASITLADPIGIYLQALQTAEWETPDGTDPQTFWTVTRGEPGRGVRAVVEVPDSLGYTLAEVKIGGVNVQSPSQIAEHITVVITGIAHEFGIHDHPARPCAADAGQLESIRAAAVPSINDLRDAAAGSR